MKIWSGYPTTKKLLSDYKHKAGNPVRMQTLQNIEVEFSDEPKKKNAEDAVNGKAAENPRNLQNLRPIATSQEEGTFFNALKEYGENTMTSLVKTGASDLGKLALRGIGFEW